MNFYLVPKKFAVLVACILGVFVHLAVYSANRPNIVVILADDMGYTDIGCYGSEIGTPHLDSLAANGLRFTQFYNAGRCCPTRASLLTGLYPHQADIGHMMETYSGAYLGNLSKDSVTIAEALKSAGYKSYMSGKWHVTKHVNPKNESERYNWPLQRGFDRFYGTIHGAGSFFDPNSLTRGNQLISPESDPKYKPERFYYTDAITDNAIRYIEEHDEDSPFFVYVAYTAAHWPLHAFPEDIAEYEGRYDAGYEPIRVARYQRALELGVIGENSRLSPRIGDWEAQPDPSPRLLAQRSDSPRVGDWEAQPDKEWEAACMEVYAAMIDRMDRGIGKLVGTLRSEGVLDNTLIFYMQDNGGCQEAYGRDIAGPRVERGSKENPMAEHELQYDMTPKKSREGYPMRRGHVMPGPADTAIGYGVNWANVSNTPFRFYKHYVHEGGISTPLIVHWPNGIQGKNELRHTPGHLIDIMATCMDVAGAQYPRTYDGNSIQPLEGKSLVSVFRGGEIEREYLFWEHEGNRAIRIGDWKLVAVGRHGEDEVHWELYDLSKDRSELFDLSESHPEKKQELLDMWHKHAKRTEVLPWPEKSRRR
jgi:arylsulfatase A-like enzyme